jgi:ABC-type molybdenum transport system ATPase subunit/photorepair protein PhrA
MSVLNARCGARRNNPGWALGIRRLQLGATTLVRPMWNRVWYRGCRPPLGRQAFMPQLNYNRKAMLTRIYIDNHRCFVNFDLRLKSKQLILGLNGTGKSALLNVLRKLRDFAVVGYKIDQVFDAESRTRWQTLPRQTFELEVTGNGGTYVYTLWVETPNEPQRSHVIKEALEFNEKPVILFHEDQVDLFDENHVQKGSYPFDPDRSTLAVMGPRRANKKLAWFKEWLNGLYCLRIDPSHMGAEGKEEEDYPEDDLSNFAGWYSHVIQEQTGAALDLQRSLREVIDGFDSLDLKKVGRRTRALRASFQQPSANEHGPSRKQLLEFDFEEISDGQRALIALYSLVHFAVGPDATICLDEPENFLALAEIQPWLFALTDRIENGGGQAILVSHHPELINLLAPQHGIVFSRTGFGPVRVAQYHPLAPGTLSPSEQIARGW